MFNRCLYDYFAHSPFKIKQLIMYKFIISLFIVSHASCGVEAEKGEVQVLEGDENPDSQIKTIVDVQIFDGDENSDSLIKTIAYERVIFDSNKLFPKFYWSLLKDTTNNHYFKDVQFGKHLKENMDVFGQTVNITPYNDSRDLLVYKLFHDSLGRLSNLSLLIDFNKRKEVVRYGLKITTAKFNKVKKHEEVFNSFSVYDTLFDPFEEFKKRSVYYGR